MEIAARVAARLVGHRFVEVTRREYDWVLKFTNDVRLRVECPWRVVVEGRLAHGAQDDGQRFGLPEPVDGEAKSKSLLADKTIKGVTIREDTGDLTITFVGQTALEILNMSAGYEGWELNAAGLIVIANGGGHLTLYMAKE